MKTYTKKIGADRAIAAILAANAEEFEAQGVTLEPIKNADGAWFIRCTGMSHMDAMQRLLDDAHRVANGD